MRDPSSSARVVRFGIYTLDEHSGELHRNGVKVRLAEQPFQLLRLLVGRPGEVVTREEIRTHLWPSDTFVAFDVGLNSAVRKLRDAIGDSADNPRFIETLPRRGYRFIVPVQRPDTAEPPRLSTYRGGRTNRTLYAGVALALTLVSAVVAIVFTGGGLSGSAADREAQAAYEQGLVAAGRGTADAYLKAVKYFEDAVAWRPDFATAHATLARAQLQLLYDGPLSPREVVPKAESAARTAVDLDDTVAAAHQVLGVILHLYYWRWEEGRKEFRRARDLETRVVDKQRRSAFRLIQGGRFGEGAVEIERARQTDPLSPEPFISAADLYQRAGQHDRAVAAFQQAADIAPRLARPRFLLGRLFLQMGKVDDAIENLEAAVRLSEINPRFYACLGVAYAAGGRTAEARRLVSELEERARREYVSAFGIALIYDALAEKSAALSAFDRAYEDRAIELAQMADYPPFRTIASEPIFQSRIQTIGRRPGNLTMAIDSRR